MLALLAHHWFTLVWLAAVAVGLPVAWRWLAQYKAVAAVEARIAAAAARGSTWSVALLHLEGSRSAALMGLASAFATAKDWAGSMAHAALGLGPDDLAPFQDSTLLHTFFADGVAMKVMAALSLVAALLSIKGKLFAARLTPAA